MLGSKRAYFSFHDYPKFKWKKINEKGKDYFKWILLMEEHWTVNYTSTQSFIMAQSYLYAQKRWVLLLNFDWLDQNCGVQRFQPLV